MYCCAEHVGTLLLSTLNIPVKSNCLYRVYHFQTSDGLFIRLCNHLRIPHVNI